MLIFNGLYINDYCDSYFFFSLSTDVVAAEFPARKTGKKIKILTSQVSWVRKARESRVVPINFIFLRIR